MCQHYAEYLYIFHALFTSDRPISALHVRVIRRRRRNGERNNYSRRKPKKTIIAKPKKIQQKLNIYSRNKITTKTQKKNNENENKKITTKTKKILQKIIRNYNNK